MTVSTSGNGNQALAPVHAAPSPSKQTASVLVVDDHPANVLALEVTLQPLGQRVVTASSGLEALERAQEEQFAAILLDVRMHGMDGVETAAKLRTIGKNRHTPVLLLSAAGLDESDVLKGYAHGAVDFLRKPFAPEVLRAKVAAFVDLYLRAQDLRGQELELRRRERQSQLTSDVGIALTRGESRGGALQQCAQALVRHLDIAFARVWALDTEENVLELRASAGMYTHLNGAHGRVPVGKFKIGLIAEEMKPHVTNDVTNDPRVGDQEWARREGMVAFAGYPLVVDDRLVGVMAVFAQRPLTHDSLTALGSVADSVSLGIERERTERARSDSLAREKRRSEQLRGLANASLAIHSVSSVDEILSLITAKARDLVGAHQAAAIIMQAQVPASSAVSLSDKYAKWRDSTALLDGFGIFPWVCETNNPVRLTPAELEAHPRFRGFGKEASDQPPLRGCLAAPLIGRDGKNLGLVQLSDRYFGDFSEDDEAILSQLAHMASVAIENARLLAQTQAAVKALERSNAELDQFAYVASHDLKAPLRGIASLSQWLEDDLGEALSSDSREQLRLMRSRVKRMEGLINGILDYSRATRTRSRPEQLDVNKVAADVIELLVPVPPAQVEVVGQLPVVYCERVPLQQVLLNLVSNALKHAKRSDAHVRIAASEAGEFWQFAVSDNGPGVAPEFHDRIWTIFQTLEARDTLESTGIGLSVVRKIVEHQGGRAWIESSLGAGATFHFTWPKAVQESS